MKSSNPIWLIAITVLALAAIGIVAVNNIPLVNYPVPFHQGLDLQGGMQVLLEADTDCTKINDDAMNSSVRIVEQRVNALAVTEPLIQRQGKCRIVVELPGVKDPETAAAAIKKTALLEFVQVGYEQIAAGTIIQTDCADPSQVDCVSPTGLAPTPVATQSLTDTASLTSTLPVTPTGTIYHTVMTGAGLSKATAVAQDGVGVQIEFTAAGTRLFDDFAAKHQGEALAIVLDKMVLSAPTLSQSYYGGNGFISGSFSIEEAQTLAMQLQFGALPVPLRIERQQVVSPTLGEDSVRQSLLAGIIGLSVVVLFMVLYYRLPGVVAAVALLIYAAITLALFKLIPVTLTLPGIAGFVLSVGVAVDANVLIFERMKEELRAGKNLRSAVEAGFNRAWSSIRDSNISTLITCVILFVFGNTFGASVVKGFAVTLALGVFVSLFTAILVTRSILHQFLDRIDFSTKHSWFGI